MRGGRVAKAPTAEAKFAHDRDYLNEGAWENRAL